MEYMCKSEIEWGRKQGLKKTSLRTNDGLRRVVYRAKDGRLYYRQGNFWHGTFEEYCYDTAKHTEGDE